MNKIETKIKVLEFIKRGISNIIENIDSNEFTKELENEFDEFENELQSRINNLNKTIITDDEINSKYHTVILTVCSVDDFASLNYKKFIVKNEETNEKFYASLNTRYFRSFNLPKEGDKVILGTLKSKRHSVFNKYNCKILKVIDNG